MNDVPETVRAPGGIALNPPVHCDLVVVGAGISGVFLVHGARERGLSVRCFEAGSGVGGTWYWNRYPGCRVDMEGAEYSYSFSADLERDWKWTERYPGQPELLRYIDHVADRFGLREHIRFDTRVTSARFDEAGAFWEVGTDSGDVVRARFCVLATGILSQPHRPLFEGAEDFRGEQLQTSRWPGKPTSFAGKHVGVIGTGASGIQLIPLVAEQAKHLYVFQRTPSYSIPLRNRPLDAGDRRSMEARRADVRAAQAASFAGMSALHSRPEAPPTRSALEVNAEERRREYEDRWRSGGLCFYNAYTDILSDPEANRTLAEFVDEKIRSRVRKPGVAEKLIPTTVPILTRRLAGDTGYCETFDRANVSLIDVNETPIEGFARDGIRVGGRVIPLDVVVYATGFDVGTGAASRIDIRGRRGRRLREHWARGLRTCLGMMSAGFPNLFWVAGPGMAFVNGFQIAEYQGGWILRCIDHVRSRSLAAIEPTRRGESEWTAHHEAVCRQTLFPRSRNYYMGDNIPGKPRGAVFYFGGFPRYRDHCEAVAAGGYRDFRLTATAPSMAHHSA